MLISIIHPSLGRPVQARMAYDHWLKTASGDHEYEWILSLSQADASIEEYHHSFLGTDAILLVAPTKSVVQAANEGAKVCAGQIIIVASDDMFSPEMWDSRILHKFEMIEGPGLLQIDDQITTKKMTLPIMNREAYARLGYVYHPAYISMYADDDLRATAIANGMYYNGTDIVFDHRHFSVGKSKYDSTYRTENSPKAYKQGQILYYERAKLKFPI